MAARMQKLLSAFRARTRTPSHEQAEVHVAQGQYADAVAIWRDLVDKDGSAVQAQLRLAQAYERGEGVLPNAVDSVRWYNLAAAQGSIPAMTRLGEVYLMGLAAPAIATPAAQQTLRETGRGSLLNQLYPEGLAVAQDLGLAAKWNTLAAQAGDPGAQARLGHQYASGLGLKLDLDQAERWFAESARQGHAAGELGLACCSPEPMASGETIRARRSGSSAALSRVIRRRNCVSDCCCCLAMRWITMPHARHSCSNERPRPGSRVPCFIWANCIGAGAA